MSGITFPKNAEKIIEQQLQDRLNKITTVALQKTADDIEKLITKFIQTYFYDALPEGEVYKRTGQLLRSVTQTKMTKVGNTYKILIYLDPFKEGNYDNKGSIIPDHKRFYINNQGNIKTPKNYSQEFDANKVFNLASKGIHGLPANSLSTGWKNTRFKQTTPGFWDKVNESLDTTDILNKYSNYINKLI